MEVGIGTVCVTPPPVIVYPPAGTEAPSVFVWELTSLVAVPTRFVAVPTRLVESVASEVTELTMLDKSGVA
jgi:hypothetical protein